MFKSISLIKRDLKLLIQKLIRGWSDEETWSLDYTLALYILPRLKRFKELNIGYFTDDQHHSPEDWDATLDKMIYAFTAISRKWECNEDGELWENIDDYTLVQEGLELFGRYFMDLWW